MLILVLAAGLRLTGISFGLDLDDPRSTLPGPVDERGMVDAVRDGFLRGSLDPGGFLFRGPAGFLLFGTVDAALIGAGNVVGARGWSERMEELDRNPSWLHLVHRLISAAAGIASVGWLVRIVGRELGRASGVFAGLGLAVSCLHVRLSHFGTVDAVWGLTVLVALDRMFLWIRAPGPRRAAVSGLWAGISAAFKYFSVLLGAHLLLAAWFARDRARPWASARALLLALAATPVGFVLVYPGLFGSFDELLAIFTRVSDMCAPATVGALLRTGSYHVVYSLGIGLGEPLAVLSLAGLVLSWKRGQAGRFLALALVLFVPVLFLTNVRAVRYAVPVLLLMAACSGVAVAALVARTRPFLRVPLVLLLIAPSLARSVGLDVVMVRGDTRAAMLAELARRDLPADEVLAIGSHHGLPQPASAGTRPFFVYGPRSRLRGRVTMAGIVARPPRLILVDLTVALASLPERPELERLLRERYREVLRLDGRSSEADAVDGSPALMLPYVRPWAVSRAGPPLVLYELVGSEAAR